MGTNRDRCFAFTSGKSVEGGWNHVAGDAGGETYNGIARNFHGREKIWRELDARRPHVHGAHYPELDGMVREFYTRKFWVPSGAGRFPYPLSLVIFDHAVNAGHVIARKALQRAIGARADGQIGPKTMRRARDLVRRLGIKGVCTRALDQRVISFARSVQRKPRQAKFLLGWWRRTILINTRVHNYRVPRGVIDEWRQAA